MPPRAPLIGWERSMICRCLLRQPSAPGLQSRCLRVQYYPVLSSVNFRRIIAMAMIRNGGSDVSEHAGQFQSCLKKKKKKKKRQILIIFPPGSPAPVKLPVKFPPVAAASPPEYSGPHSMDPPSAPSLSSAYQRVPFGHVSELMPDPLAWSP